MDTASLRDLTGTNDRITYIQHGREITVRNCRKLRGPWRWIATPVSRICLERTRGCREPRHHNLITNGYGDKLSRSSEAVPQDGRLSRLLAGRQRSIGDANSA